MGHAKHIGRVGALAVALGVGMAVATTPGVAWATAEPDSADATTAPDSTKTLGRPINDTRDGEHDDRAVDNGDDSDQLRCAERRDP